MGTKCFDEITLTCYYDCKGDCDSACSVPLRSRLVLRLASRRWGPGVPGWRLALLESLLTLWWRLLETTSGHWVRTSGTQQITREKLPEVNTVVGIQSFSNLLHLLFPGQVFQWKVRLRPRLNVTTRAMDPVMCATGPQSLGSMLYMCSATMKTSSTLPLWLRLSTHQAKISTPTRYAPNQGHCNKPWVQFKSHHILCYNSFFPPKVPWLCYSRLRHMVQAFRAAVWLLESPLSSLLMPSKEEKLLWRLWLR